MNLLQPELVEGGRCSTRRALDRLGLKGIALLLFAALCGCAHVPSPPPAPESDRLGSLHLRYRVTYRTDPHALDVDVTLEGPARDFLFTQAGPVEKVTATINGVDEAIPVEAYGRVAVPDGTTRLRYRYLVPSVPDLYAGAGEPGALVIAGRAYLIRPRVADRVRATLVIQGARALLPWKPEEDGAFDLSGSELVDSGFHSFGGTRCTEEVDGAQLEISILREGSKLASSDDTLCAWIRDAARETLNVRAHFPYRRITVNLLPAPSRKPAPFGLTLWSIPPSMAILVGEHAKPDDFREDWVAVHEMLHLMHPSFMHQGPWISEGLATYYGEVAQMRSGRHSAEQGWTALVHGFDKARGEGEHWTLGDAERGLRGGIYLPIYWAGALLMLELDVAIRDASHGARSLDDVLDLLGRRGPTATIGDFQRAVDEVAGRQVYETIVAPHRTGPVFADLEALLARLGIRRSADGVDFVTAPDSTIRAAIGRVRGTVGD